MADLNLKSIALLLIFVSWWMEGCRKNPEVIPSSESPAVTPVEPFPPPAPRVPALRPPAESIPSTRPAEPSPLGFMAPNPPVPPTKPPIEIP